MSQQQTQPQLLASYKSPSSSQTFSHDLPAQPKGGAENVQEKTAYLAELRRNAVKLQGEINEFLTRKMEEDQDVEAQEGKKKKDENREEEMYGEEDPEQDELMN